MRPTFRSMLVLAAAIGALMLAAPALAASPANDNFARRDHALRVIRLDQRVHDRLDRRDGRAGRCEREAFGTRGSRRLRRGRFRHLRGSELRHLGRRLHGRFPGGAQPRFGGRRGMRDQPECDAVPRLCGHQVLDQGWRLQRAARHLHAFVAAAGERRFRRRPVSERSLGQRLRVDLRRDGGAGRAERQRRGPLVLHGRLPATGRSHSIRAPERSSTPFSTVSPDHRSRDWSGSRPTTTRAGLSLLATTAA